MTAHEWAAGTRVEPVQPDPDRPRSSAGGGSVPQDRDPRRMSGRYVTLVLAGLSLITLTCIAFIVPMPYGSMRPGPAFDTFGDFEEKPMIAFGEGVKTYETDGALLFTTVSVSRQDYDMSLFRALAVYFEPDSMLVPSDVLHPRGVTQEESQEMTAAQLDQSKANAEIAGLKAAGVEVSERPMLASIIEGGPSFGLLEPGDIVVSVDGIAVGTPDAMVGLIAKADVGDEIEFVVERAGTEKKVSVKTVAADDDPDKPIVGVSVRAEYDSPIEVENNVGHSIGGPSAGLMFALAIYDKLTPGALTQGLRVAGTGEIGVDGTVGAIGGIRQKMAGAASQSAEVFLVPAGNCAEARRDDDHGLKLVEVETIDDAIESLETLAGDPDAKVPACK